MINFKSDTSLISGHGGLDRACKPLLRFCIFSSFGLGVLLSSCGGLEPVVFQDNVGSSVAMQDGSYGNAPLTELPTDRPSADFAGMSDNGMQHGAGIHPPVSIVDTIPGTFIPEAEESGFDLFNVENPIELSDQGLGSANDTQTSPQTVNQSILSGQSYGLGNTGLSYAPDTTKREVVVRSYNHTPGSVGLNVGDTFTFSNPTTAYTVRSITVDSIFWDADNDEQSVTTHNLLMPAASWSSEGRGQGSREITQVQGGLFPLAVGNTMSFKAVTSANISPYRWESFWSCSVINRGFVTVVAGEFDAYVITCSRSSLDEVTFYFAPKLGHYVRQEVKAPGNPEVYVRELIAYDRPSLSYAAGLPSRVDNTLMTGISPGSQAKFRSTHLPGETSVESDLEDAIAAQRRMAGSSVRNTFSEGAAQGEAGQEKSDNAVMRRDSSSVQKGSNAVARVLSQEAPSGIYAHLASYQEEENVSIGENVLRTSVPALREASFTSMLVNVPSKGGDFFRLFVGPFSSASEAMSVCNSVRELGRYCQVTQAP